MSGGARPGAGRKPIPAHLLKVPVSFKLPRPVVERLRAAAKAAGISQAVLVERALAAYLAEYCRTLKGE